MRWFRIASICFIVALILGCGGIGLAYEKRLVGDIGLAAVDTRTQMAVVEFNGGGTDTLVPGTIFAVGWDELHIIAKRHPPDAAGRVDKAQVEYFILTVRDRKVYGPFDEPAYRSQRGVLGVGESLDFTLKFDDLD
jgi:hypothetical protein